MGEWTTWSCYGITPTAHQNKAKQICAYIFWNVYVKLGITYRDNNKNTFINHSLSHLCLKIAENKMIHQINLHKNIQEAQFDLLY